MYQGTNPKALQSMHRIDSALMRLLETTPYSSISITALCKEAGVSRPTFYKNFEDREDVVVHILKQLFVQVSLPGQMNNLEAVRGALRSFMQLFAEHLTLLRLVSENHLEDIFARELREVAVRSIQVDDAYMGLGDYLFSYYIGGLTALLMYWCQQGHPLDSDTICELAETLVIEGAVSQGLMGSRF